RCPGDPDQLFDLVADPHEQRNLVRDGEAAGTLARLGAEAAERWNLRRLEADVRASQRRRHLVGGALALRRRTAWEHEPDRATAARYGGGERDFWPTIRGARVRARDGLGGRT